LVTLVALFPVALIGQALTGWRAYFVELPAISFPEYLMSGHFTSAEFDNCKSEVLQMAAYVLLTVLLFQKGSAERESLMRAAAVNLAWTA
jgi:hypothetical protein